MREWTRPYDVYVMITRERPWRRPVLSRMREALSSIQGPVSISGTTYSSSKSSLGWKWRATKWAPPAGNFGHATFWAPNRKSAPSFYLSIKSPEAWGLKVPWRAALVLAAPSGIEQLAKELASAVKADEVRFRRRNWAKAEYGGITGAVQDVLPFEAFTDDGVFVRGWARK